MRRSMRGHGWKVAFLLVAVGGCRRAPTVESESEQALAGTGVKLEAPAAVAPGPYAAVRCWSGRIDGLDALACEYGDAAAAHSGRRRPEQWIGAAVTGMVVDRGRIVLALADRTRADPDGKKLAAIGWTITGRSGGP